MCLSRCSSTLWSGFAGRDWIASARISLSSINEIATYKKTIVSDFCKTFMTSQIHMLMIGITCGQSGSQSIAESPSPTTSNGCSNLAEDDGTATGSEVEPDPEYGCW